MLFRSAEGQRVRVNLVDRVKNTRPEGVHVKVVGSVSQRFISGETDLRGVFVADGIQGKVTVIARDKKDGYAFYRGETWLGQHIPVPPPDTLPAPQPSTTVPSRKTQESDFRYNIEEFNRSIQEENEKKLRTQMRSINEGVQMQDAY